MGVRGQSSQAKFLGPHPLDHSEMHFLIMEIRPKYTINESELNNILMHFIEIEVLASCQLTKLQIESPNKNLHQD